MRNKTFLPAEWAPQSGIQLTWPHAATDWAPMLEEVEACYVELAVAIASRTKLLIVSPDTAHVRTLLEPRIDMTHVRLFECPTNDTWARDHGGITLLVDGEPVICDFKFNGWGLKFAACHDNLITSRLYEGGMLHATYANHLNFVLEGGAIESDGEGTLMTTSECLLSKNRNGEWDKMQLEEYLKTTFNLRRVLWVDHGFLAGDDTDSHIDTLARLCPNHTIAYVRCEDTADEHYDALLAMEEQLRSFRTTDGTPYRLIALPMADAIYDGDDRLPATYANFLIMNDAILYPTYNQPDNDVAAAKALASAFPGREIVGIDCRALIKQHGSLHCVTMQYPENVII